MLQQAYDFRDESDALAQLLEPLSEAEFDQPTLFKNWTISHVLGHLHMWNWAAHLSLTDEAGFQAWGAEALPQVMSNGIRAYEEVWLDGLSGRALYTTWRDFYRQMTEDFAQADPKARVKWAGPDMSVRSSISARLMETWAHGQEVYDALGVVRENTDRIKNIAQLGINTFGWTFANRGEQPPGPVPRVNLTAPSGEQWEWNEDNTSDCVSGSAEEFCQVVTQTRSIGDTQLQVEGDVARQWMAVAQCFAGPVETPPAPGQRHTAS
jgi:uncharacterized protein (TIGR03084 family)